MNEPANHLTTLRWLGHSGFAIEFANIQFVVDPCLAEIPGRTRLTPPPVAPRAVDTADLILCTHAHAGHMNRETLVPMLDASRQAKVVLPKSASAQARAIGIPYERMTTTDSGLRVEYFKDGMYGRVYAVPSAHEHLDWTPTGGYPYLGYCIRFGEHTIYHAGDCVMYDDLVTRLKPYNVTVALLPVSGRNFSAVEAAQLAEDIGARWLVPMHYGAFEGSDADASRFIEHMLGQRPAQRFKVFESGEKWTIPAE